MPHISDEEFARLTASDKKNIELEASVKTLNVLVTKQTEEIYSEKAAKDKILEEKKVILKQVEDNKTKPTIQGIKEEDIAKMTPNEKALYNEVEALRTKAIEYEKNQNEAVEKEKIRIDSVIDNKVKILSKGNPEIENKIKEGLKLFDGLPRNTEDEINTIVGNAYKITAPANPAGVDPIADIQGTPSNPTPDASGDNFATTAAGAEVLKKFN